MIRSLILSEAGAFRPTVLITALHSCNASIGCHYRGFMTGESNTWKSPVGGNQHTEEPRLGAQYLAGESKAYKSPIIFPGSCKRTEPKLGKAPGHNKTLAVSQLLNQPPLLLFVCFFVLA